MSKDDLTPEQRDAAKKAEAKLSIELSKRKNSNTNIIPFPIFKSAAFNSKPSRIPKYKKKESFIQKLEKSMPFLTLAGWILFLLASFILITIMSYLNRNNTPIDPKCNIKADTSVIGTKYYLPNHHHYDDIIINPTDGDKWFCNEAEAKAAGFIKSLD